MEDVLKERVEDSAKNRGHCRFPWSAQQHDVHTVRTAGERNLRNDDPCVTPQEFRLARSTTATAHCVLFDLPAYYDYEQLRQYVRIYMSKPDPLWALEGCPEELKQQDVLFQKDTRKRAQLQEGHPEQLQQTMQIEDQSRGSLCMHRRIFTLESSTSAEYAHTVSFTQDEFAMGVSIAGTGWASIPEERKRNYNRWRRAVSRISRQRRRAALADWRATLRRWSEGEPHV